MLVLSPRSRQEQDGVTHGVARVGARGLHLLGLMCTAGLHGGRAAVGREGDFERAHLSQRNDSAGIAVPRA